MKSKSNSIDIERTNIYASTPPRIKRLSRKQRRPPVPMRTDSTRSVGTLLDSQLHKTYHPLQSVKEDEFLPVNALEKYPKVNDCLMTWLVSYNSFGNTSQPFRSLWSKTLERIFLLRTHIHASSIFFLSCTIILLPHTFSIPHHLDLCCVELVYARVGQLYIQRCCHCYCSASKKHEDISHSRWKDDCLLNT